MQCLGSMQQALMWGGAAELLTKLRERVALMQHAQEPSALSGSGAPEAASQEASDEELDIDIVGDLLPAGSSEVDGDLRLAGDGLQDLHDPLGDPLGELGLEAITELPAMAGTTCSISSGLPMLIWLLLTTQGPLSSS